MHAICDADKTVLKRSDRLIFLISIDVLRSFNQKVRDVSCRMNAKFVYVAMELKFRHETSPVRTMRKSCLKITMQWLIWRDFRFGTHLDCIHPWLNASWALIPTEAQLSRLEKRQNPVMGSSKTNRIASEEDETEAKVRTPYSLDVRVFQMP